MARLARKKLFHAAEESVVHCTQRCVRRGFLCGYDPASGKNYEHRKAWLEERLAELAAHFGIDVEGHAILSHHFHVVLRNRPDVVATWSDSEVARRWLLLCPRRRTDTGQPAEPSEAELDTIRNVPQRLRKIRVRLSSISWFMSLLAQPISRRANREDQVTGHFWQGRYHAVKICDEAALLACLAYADLNPIRAGLADSLEGSAYTSVQRRIAALEESHLAARDRADAWLAPLAIDEAHVPLGPQPSTSARRASDKGCLPMKLSEYLALVDWTGRQLHPRGRIPDHRPPILERLGLATEHWLPLVRNFGKLFYRVAGRAASLERVTPAHRFHPGHSHLLECA